MSGCCSERGLSRRFFLKLAAYFISLLALPYFMVRKVFARNKSKAVLSERSITSQKPDAGVYSDRSSIYIVRNGLPEENMKKVLEMMGGIGNLIGHDDIVILKPNAQWWMQGMTNTDAMKEFIESVLGIPGFRGEIIIADNHHYGDDNSVAWTTSHRNGRFNYNELIDFFHRKGHPNVTKYHWHDAGPNPRNRQGNASGDNRVNGPKDGDGYVWCDDLVYKTPSGRKCMMTYPIFTSSYSGLTIDLKNGVWGKGEYLDRPLKFINFSALNHHGSYAGVTASVKNLMGVVDMTCGHHGTEPEGYYNMHYIGDEGAINLYVEKASYYFRRLGLKSIGKLLNSSMKKLSYFDFFYTGGALGYWIKHVRSPDLNIITAEWVGWGGRISETDRSQTKAILASKDPVALDYYASKYVLLPATLSGSGREELALLHDPDIKEGVFRKFLDECHKQGIGTLDENRMEISSYDYSSVDARS